MRGQVTHPDGTTIAYEVTGQGPPLVLVHGITNRGRSWRPVTQLLRRDLTCVAIDLRGHGESSMADDYGMVSLVSDVHLVVQELGLEAPAVVGHSMGGVVATVYGALHSPRCVVIVDVGLRVGDFAEMLQPFAGRLSSEDCMNAVLEIEHLLGATDPSGPGEQDRRVLSFPAEVVRGLWSDLLTTPPAEMNRLMESVLPLVSAPVLALHGDLPQPDYEQWLTAMIPSVTVEAWQGSGHFLHLADPTRFANRLLDFLPDDAKSGSA